MSRLQSMTGQGSARAESAGIRVQIECRSLNGRYLKTQLRVGDMLRGYEAEIEKRIRKVVHRGTVSVSVRVEHTEPSALVAVDEDVVRAYKAVFARLDVPLHAIPTLPGVLEGGSKELSADQLMIVDAALDEALEAMRMMREHEGAAIGRHLLELVDSIEAGRLQIAERAPEVVREYRDRLRNRIASLLDGSSVELDDVTLSREVALYASRADVTEEVERIEGHLQQIRDSLASGEPAGRTLDFLGQELHREINTVGSKSADRELASIVIALKTAVDRFKEQVANVQ
ncbi:MAG: YicC/YloC family endoribonuclease [Myxococcota bacterium]